MLPRWSAGRSYAFGKGLRITKLFLGTMRRVRKRSSRVCTWHSVHRADEGNSRSCSRTPRRRCYAETVWRAFDAAMLRQTQRNRERSEQRCSYWLQDRAASIGERHWLSVQGMLGALGALRVHISTLGPVQRDVQGTLKSMQRWLLSADFKFGRVLLMQFVHQFNAKCTLNAVIIMSALQGQDTFVNCRDMARTRRSTLSGIRHVARRWIRSIL